MSVIRRIIIAVSIGLSSLFFGTSLVATELLIGISLVNLFWGFFYGLAPTMSYYLFYEYFEHYGFVVFFIIPIIQSLCVMLLANYLIKKCDIFFLHWLVILFICTLLVNVPFEFAFHINRFMYFPLWANWAAASL